MSITPMPRSLQRVLLADAITCAAMGLALALAPDAVGRITDIPISLLFYAGLGLLPIAAFIVAATWGPLAHPAAVRLVVAGNALWVVGSFALIFGLIAPNGVGAAFIVVQALAVALLTWLEFAGLRLWTAAAGNPVRAN